VSAVQTTRARCRLRFRGRVAVAVAVLAPACASFDMFRDYRQRGAAFAAAVAALEG